MIEPKLQQLCTRFIEDHALQPSFVNTISEYYLPLAQWLNRHRPQHRTWVIGLNGAQGTGKSTLSALLKLILETSHNCSTAVISLDDLYLPRADRQILAQTIHPLLQTRGVPGTHDTQLGINLLNSLCQLQKNQSIMLPRFDKASDDRLPEENWALFNGPAQIIIFEGWCVGSTASTEQSLSKPINALEATEDKNGTWRNYANQQLQTNYTHLFAPLDRLIFLQAPNFSCIHRWRWQQEQMLVTPPRQNKNTQIMDKVGIKRFIQHFERLSRQNLKQLPELADITLLLDNDHRIVQCHYKNP